MGRPPSSVAQESRPHDQFCQSAFVVAQGTPRAAMSTDSHSLLNCDVRIASVYLSIQDMTLRHCERRRGPRADVYALGVWATSSRFAPDAAIAP
jgi:hypothetical protein